MFLFKFCNSSSSAAPRCP